MMDNADGGERLAWEALNALAGAICNAPADTKTDDLWHALTTIYGHEAVDRAREIIRENAPK